MTKPISYKDQLLNKSITEYFGEEEGDIYQDKESLEEEEEYLADYDLMKIYDRSVEEE